MKREISARVARIASRRRPRGIVLLLALLMVALASLAATATLERLLMQTRIAAGEVDRIRAFHAADAGLQMCERRYLLHPLDVAEWREPDEPVGWRRPAAFNDVSSTGAAVARALVAEWPGAAEPPRCLIELWLREGETQQTVLFTSKSVGADRATERWVQAWWFPEGSRLHHAWRLVADPP
ncbi:MAG: pilus assembly PilX family protein [Janthinobacterium lividum]